MRLEKPDSVEEWLAAITVALSVTVFVSLPIVVGVMWLLLDAPAWALGLALAVIGAFSIVLVCSPDVGDDSAHAEGGTHWEIVRPTGLAGWAKHIGMIWLTWAGISLIVNTLIIGEVFNGGVVAKAIASVILLVLAIAIETIDVVDDTPADQASRTADAAVSFVTDK